MIASLLTLVDSNPDRLPENLPNKADDDAIMLYTSGSVPPDIRDAHFLILVCGTGTTGHPKGVVLTHRGLVNQMLVVRFLWCVRMPTLSMIFRAQAEIAEAVKGKLGVKDPHPPCTILTVPLFHATACHHVFLSSFHQGKKVSERTVWAVLTRGSYCFEKVARFASCTSGMLEKRSASLRKRK